MRGLRLFAVDFGRARASVARGDLATAAQQLVDRRALRLVSGATAEDRPRLRRLTRVCEPLN